MWLLNTSRAELHYFADPGTVPGGYAVISHTWNQDRGEQTFEEVMATVSECEKTCDNPRDRVDEKVRRCCEVAELDGYSWVWLDSCCINKGSSTELSEAVNSMFNWYALSEVCYAYLEDVHFNDDPYAEESEFRKARWHTRGWTLQELLAPAFVIFMSQEWKPIGTKHDLCRLIEECTGISQEYLTRQWDFRSAPIARRMAWAADRKATRVEDEAYCLLGLFGINMPTLYGEGRQAFQRLQAKLVKKNLDTSIFAWGSWHEPRDNALPQASLFDIHSGFYTPHHLEKFLFATSPREFRGRHYVHYTPFLWGDDVLQPYLQTQWSDEHQDNLRITSELQERGPFGHVELPSFEVTLHGMKCRFPIAEIDGVTIAVLLCETNEEHLGIFLHPAPDHVAQDPTRKAYYVSWAFQKSDFSQTSRRLVSLGGDLYNLHFRDQPVVASWRDIYIVAHPRPTERSDGAHLIQRFLPDFAPSPFRVPRSLLQALARLKLFPQTWRAYSDSASIYVMGVVLENTFASEAIRVMIGLCGKVPPGAPPCHWAWDEVSYLETWDEPWSKTAHDCATDHIEGWTGSTCDFGNAERRVRLRFTPCPHAPVRTLVLNLELLGNVYERLQHAEGVALHWRGQPDTEPPTKEHQAADINTPPEPVAPWFASGHTQHVLQLSTDADDALGAVPLAPPAPPLASSLPSVLVLPAESNFPFPESWLRRDTSLPAPSFSSARLSLLVGQPPAPDPVTQDDTASRTPRQVLFRLRAALRAFRLRRHHQVDT